MFGGEHQVEQLNRVNQVNTKPQIVCPRNAHNFPGGGGVGGHKEPAAGYIHPTLDPNPYLVYKSWSRLCLI